MTQQLQQLLAKLEIIGQSPLMLEAFEFVDRVAPTDVTALILGENGTGKELIAKAIHFHSPRANGPLLPLNCAAIPETLLESELFGYAPRAGIAGADSRGKAGSFEAASGGTIFLDEVGDMSSSTQAKVLRVLEDKTIRRLGSNSPVRVDVRIVAATSRDLNAEVNASRFRKDLLYRLNHITIPVPPLRKRTNDLPLLANAFLRRWTTQHGKVIRDFEAEAVDILLSYAWPGNVRQLLHGIEHAVLFCDGELIKGDDLPAEIRGVPAERIRKIILVDDEPFNRERFVEGAKSYKFRDIAIEAAGLGPNTEIEIISIHPSQIGRSPDAVRDFLRHAILLAVDINFEDSDGKWGWENGVDFAMFAIEHMAHLSRRTIWLTKTPKYETFLLEARRRIARNASLADRVPYMESQLPGSDRIVVVPQAPMPAPDLYDGGSQQFWIGLRDKIREVLAECAANDRLTNIADTRAVFSATPDPEPQQSRSLEVENARAPTLLPPPSAVVPIPRGVAAEVELLILRHLPTDTNGVSKLSDLKLAVKVTAPELTETQREAMRQGPVQTALLVSLGAKLQKKWQEGMLVIVWRKKFAAGDKQANKRVKNAIYRTIKTHLEKLTW